MISLSINEINNLTNINPIELIRHKTNNNNKFTQVLQQAQKAQEQTNSEPGNTDNDKKKDELMAACRELESIFIHQLISQMRATIPQDGFLTQSSAEKIFQDMLDQEYAKKISHAGGIGLAEMLYKQLSTERS